MFKDDILSSNIILLLSITISLNLSEYYSFIFKVISSIKQILLKSLSIYHNYITLNYIYYLLCPYILSSSI